MSFTPVRLITIDLDDTVWPCAAVIARAEAELLEWLRREARSLAAEHDRDSLRGHGRAVAARRPELAHDLTAVRTESLRQLLAQSGHSPDRAEEAAAVFLAARNRVSPFPDVAPTLRALAERYLLVSVTNGNADVDRTPLAGHFHLALTAAEVGAAKPAPDIFQAALRYAAVDPGRALHVGDDPVLDVEAARRVGMRTAWVNRDGLEWPDELHPPDLIVRDCRDLQDCLRHFA
ncbi:MAG: HAD family hydrolase [Gammaproteobacteria bacterium]|nr:HAD family hydrolase [Gammaproteobacteria bacterium]